MDLILDICSSCFYPSDHALPVERALEQHDIRVFLIEAFKLGRTLEQQSEVDKLVAAFNQKSGGKQSGLVLEVLGEYLHAKTGWHHKELIPIIRFANCCIGNQPGQGNPYELQPSTVAAASKSFTRAYFFPSDTSFRVLVEQLRACRRSLDICVFTITDDDVVKAILDAKRNGAVVRIISDDEQAKSLGSDIYRIRDQHGIQVRLDKAPSHMHNKFAICDGVSVVTGSYNWTKNARNNNQENFVHTNDRDCVRAYSQEFEKLWNQFTL